MKIKSQKILSLLLVIAMLISNIIAPVQAFAGEAINENELVNMLEDIEESETTLEDVEESATTLEDIEDMYTGEKPEAKKIKISKDSKTVVDITEYMQESIRSKSKTRTKRSISGAETYAEDDVKMDLVVTAEYIALDGSKYKLEDYINENIRFELYAVYMGDELVGNIGPGVNVTDRMSPKEFYISIYDIYGYGGEKDKDLLTEDIRIAGFKYMPDYYTTSYSIGLDHYAAFKKAPSGVELDAYLIVTTESDGTEIAPVVKLSFEERAVPDGPLGDAQISKKVLNISENETEYKDSTKAKPGDEVEYKVEVVNEANIFNEVEFTDVLDENLTEIELDRSNLNTDDKFDYNKDTNTITGAAKVLSRETNSFIYRAVVGENAFDDIENIAKASKLEPFTEKLSNREDTELVEDAEDGDINTVTALNGKEYDVITYGNKGYIITSSDYKANLEIEVVKLEKGKVSDLDEDTAVKVGDTFNYTIYAENTGKGTMKDVKVTDEDVPSQLTINKDKDNTKAVITKADGTKVPVNVTVDGQSVVADTVDLLENEKIELIIAVEVNETAKNGDIIQNIGKINDEEVPGPEIPVTELELKKDSDIDLNQAVDIGDVFTYKITATNIGDIVTKNVKFYDNVPSQLDVKNVVLSDGGKANVEGNVIEYTVPKIAPNETFTMTIEVVVNDTAKRGDVVVNVGKIDGKDVPDKGVNVGPTGVRLYKYDSTSYKPLSGAVFNLYDANGNTVRENLITPRSGGISVKNIPIGKYYFKEVKAPVGYRLDSKLKGVNAVDNAISTYNMVNLKLNNYRSASINTDNLDNITLMDEFDSGKDFISVTIGSFSHKDNNFSNGINPIENNEVVFKDKNTGKIIAKEKTNKFGGVTAILPEGEYLLETTNPNESKYNVESSSSLIQEFSLPAKEEESELLVLFTEKTNEETKEDKDITISDKESTESKNEDKNTNEVKNESTSKTTDNKTSKNITNKVEEKIVSNGKVESTLDKSNVKGYLNGYSDGTIRAKANITRAEVATIFARLAKNDTKINKSINYSDVSNSAWYTEDIALVSSLGIMEGYSDGSFKPNQSITRAEFATVISRFEKLSSGDAPFKDIVGHWAEESIKSAYSKGWITGYPDGSFRPDDNILREEVATIVNRILKRVPDKEEIDKLDNPYSDITESDWSYYDLIEASNK